MRKRKYIDTTHTHEYSVFTEDIDRYIQRSQVVGNIPQAEVHNLVGTCMIHSSVLPLHLQNVSRILPNPHFDKQKFAAITLRLQDPVCTVLLFTSGKLVLTGCKTFAECICACHRIVLLLRSAIPGVVFYLKEAKIQNIVGNVNVCDADNEFIDLERFHSDHSVYCTYQKNMFPGLIYRPVNSPVVLLLFVSGKIVLTGAKSACSMHKGWEDVWPLIRSYLSVHVATSRHLLDAQLQSPIHSSVGGAAVSRAHRNVEDV